MSQRVGGRDLVRLSPSLRDWALVLALVVSAVAGVAAGALAGTILLTYPLIDSWFGGLRFGKELRLVAHGLTGGIVYGAAALAMMLITGLSLRRGGCASAQRKGA